MAHEDTLPRGVFYQNYDLYDTGDPSPGTGLYQHMDKYKSVADFRKKKRKSKMRRRRKALMVALLLKSADDSQNTGDCSLLSDPTEDSTTPVIWNPAAPGGNLLGIYDGIAPKESLEEASETNLYYGIGKNHNLVDDK